MAERVYTQIYPVVGAILEKDGKFLLVQENAPGKPQHEKWNQAAGWIDVGETPVEAIKREVKEETGLDFKPTGLIGIYSLYREDVLRNGSHPHSIKFIFKGKIVGGKELRSNEEIMALKWFTQREINAMSLDTLRDLDIKQEVSDFLSGKNYPLGIIKHTISK